MLFLSLLGVFRLSFSFIWGSRGQGTGGILFLTFFFSLPQCFKYSGERLSLTTVKTVYRHWLLAIFKGQHKNFLWSENKDWIKKKIVNSINGMTSSVPDCYLGSSVFSFGELEGKGGSIFIISLLSWMLHSFVNIFFHLVISQLNFLRCLSMELSTWQYWSSSKLWGTFLLNSVIIRACSQGNKELPKAGSPSPRRSIPNITQEVIPQSLSKFFGPGLKHTLVLIPCVLKISLCNHSVS